MVKVSAKKGVVRKRTKDEHFNGISFPDGLLEIIPYRFDVSDKTGVFRRYVIEVHSYSGFAMIKYYPYSLKKNKKKFILRGKKFLSFELSRGEILRLIYECALIMRDYLDENPDEFIGYVGQKDEKDDIRKRTKSQRCSVYNILTSSIFRDKEIYKISQKKNI